MENWMKQIKEKLFGAEEENKADFGGSRNQKRPIQKTSSFKEKKKVHNWFQRQFSRKMSHDYDFIEIEHATAVAAAAFAISSHVSEISHENKISEFPETSLARTRSNDYNKKYASKRLSDSFKIKDEQGYNVPTASPIITEENKPQKTKTFTPTPSMKNNQTFSEKPKKIDDAKKHDIPIPKRTSTFVDTKPETPKPKMVPLVDDSIVTLRPPPPPPQSPIRQTSTNSERPSTRPNSTDTKADAWEREELKKIKERYEKLLETIDSWEKRKKMKARRKLNKHEQSENARKREKAWRKYEDKIKYIDEIAAGARAQSDERRNNEMVKAKEKAYIIKTTGKLPGACSCF